LPDNRATQQRGDEVVKNDRSVVLSKVGKRLYVSASRLADQKEGYGANHGGSDVNFNVNPPAN
jgi:hypothetical protein